jgi:hypothetical protein
MQRIITSRDVKKRSVALGVDVPTSTPPPPSVPDDYWTRLQKLIPTEVIAAFLAIDGVIQAKVGISALGYWVLYAILVLLCCLYAHRAATTQELGTNHRQVVLAILAFLIWTYAIGGPYSFSGTEFWNRALGGVVVVLFTTAAPLLAE